MNVRRSLAWFLVIASAIASGCGGSDDPRPPRPDAPPQQEEFVDDRDGLASPTPVDDRPNRRPRGVSVDYNDPPPPLAAAVVAAARAAGCRVESFRSEANPGDHTEGEAAMSVSTPPLSGTHNGRFADWGVYDRPVPFKYQLHNLEHGGVFLHYGRQVPVAGVNALREFWARSPAFLLVAPDTAPAFPEDAVVAGSHQRWIVCRPFTPEQVPAIEAFVAEYRGRGPEQQPAANSTLPAPADLPAPALPDRGAAQ